jgi:hypothetical protein
MTTTQPKTGHADQTQDRDSELQRAIRDALVLAVGKRAAQRALRRTLNHAHRDRQRRPGHLVGSLAGHLAGYGALLAYIWYQRRAHGHPEA